MSKTPRTDAVGGKVIAILESASGPAAFSAALQSSMKLFLDSMKQLERENSALIAALHGVWSNACGTQKPCGHEYICTCTMDAVKSALQKAGEIP